jgi:NAD(P)-dependent dehydrogenase (short-subunit alcohol dehydrogenase family)
MNGDPAALAAGGIGTPAQVDIGDKAAVARALTETEAQLGPVDIAVNSAGVTGSVARIR